MLRFGLLFLVIALVSTLLGFGGAALVATGTTRFVFHLFLALFVFTLLGSVLYRPSPLS